MNLNTKIKYLALSLLAAASLCACNDISDDDRFIELPQVEAKRMVLLEEFTGQKCVNCPAAHEIIADLLKSHPDGLISVSIHGGGDAFSFSEDALPGRGLRSTESQAYCDEYKVASLPAAVVNRKSGVLNSDQWAAVIREEMSKPSEVEMAMTATLNDDGQKINIETEVNPYINGPAKLQLWVVESGIVSMQIQSNGKYDTEYVHNHVFRGSVNGHNGEDVTLVTRTPQSFTHEIAVRSDKNATWNPDNLYIVGFVYNTDGVMQAIEAKVTPAAR